MFLHIVWLNVLKEGHLESSKIQNFLFLFPCFRIKQRDSLGPFIHFANNLLMSATTSTLVAFMVLILCCFIKDIDGVLSSRSLSFSPFVTINKFSRNVGESRSRLSYWSRSCGWFTKEKPSMVSRPKLVALMERNSRSPSSKRRPGYWYYITSITSLLMLTLSGFLVLVWASECSEILLQFFIF